MCVCFEREVRSLLSWFCGGLGICVCVCVCVEGESVYVCMYVCMSVSKCI